VSGAVLTRAPHVVQNCEVSEFCVPQFVQNAILDPPAVAHVTAELNQLYCNFSGLATSGVLMTAMCSAVLRYFTAGR
jgi:hypothetical protein